MDLLLLRILILPLFFAEFSHGLVQKDDAPIPGAGHSKCAKEGVTQHEDPQKFNFCFTLNGQSIHQVTQCPRGSCFNPGSGCCDSKACEPHPTPSYKGRQKRSPIRPGYGGGGAGSEFEITSFEMAYLHPNTVGKKRRRMCDGGGVMCTRLGTFPNPVDKNSYYRCVLNKMSNVFEAKLYDCPIRFNCFSRNKCMRCKRFGG